VPRRPALTITFHKVLTPRPHAWWDGERRTGGRLRGGYMPIGHGVIPHDLAHFATEAHFGIEDGFWGLLARGATFKRGTSQRPTRRGRALIADNRSGLHAAEHLGNVHHTLWTDGKPTPVAPTFDRLAEQWSAVPDGGTLVVCWPMSGSPHVDPVNVLPGR
jgi:hypothetical protein